MGIACPKCQAKSRTVNSRADSKAGWRRRRECTACKFRFSTIEAIPPQMTKSEAAYRALLQANGREHGLAGQMSLPLEVSDFPT